MPSSPLALAALATAAVPGLRPTQVQGLASRAGDRYAQAVVTDDEDRRWHVRQARTTSAGAALDQTERLAVLLDKRLSFRMPRLVGTASARDSSTVGVLHLLPGEPLPWRALTPRSEEARSLGRVLAELHDTDPRLYDEAGLPTYDADAYRSRRLAELDRAAATGHVPAGLLGRWERALEEVGLWRFATTPTHGSLHDGDVRVEGGEVVALDGWDEAAVSDPAADFALLSLLALPEAVDTVVESYAQSRRERPDTHLERRMRLAAELRRVTALMEAAAADDDELVERRAAALRRLEERTESDESLLPPPVARRSTGSAVGGAAPAPGPSVDPADIEVVEVRESDDDDETLEIPHVDEESADDGSGAGSHSEDDTQALPVVLAPATRAGVADRQDEQEPGEWIRPLSAPAGDRHEADTQPIRRERADPGRHAG
ncbi:protein kinase family protein [Luteipulveratus flavus]|uniref:Aminoglycoside phosphotransferase n=1 Tax=Luteipulveratus flavus TaxID=3031728 RepID=A0ABT6C838_9MICO|nr:phosphotransferase [Luteipulveratus sp. YIM 133296]MDF8265035.1 aminoglycoside phosphotransferase [Luteipulveratus sp. YIM 133296]